MNVKLCSRCDTQKPYGAFRPRVKGGTQLQSWCVDCHRDYNRGRERPDSGMLRVPTSLRDEVRKAARRNGVGMGQWLVRTLTHAIREECAKPGCVRQRANPVHGLCGRCVHAADRRADARASA